MIKTTSKLGLGLVLLSMILVGCSTSTDVETRGVQFPEPEPESEPVAETVVEVLENTFYFDFDQSTLSNEAQALLRRHAQNLKDDPVAITLVGHADERGTREYNMALGERRAKAVYEFLRLQDVTSDIDVTSLGEEDPAVEGSNEEAWALNRRVVMKFTQ